MKKLFFIILSLLISAQIAYSEEPIKNALSINKTKEKEICSAIKKTIQDGLNTKDVVKTGIKLGHSACLVIKCAIEGGGSLKEVVTGAIEAGASADVVSRCCIDAGADPQDVAGFILIAGLPDVCFFEPQMLGPTEIEKPDDQDSAGGYLSPSTP